MIDMTAATTLVTSLMSVALGLTILTNIVVQVIKGITYDKIPTNLLAFIVAFIVTGCAFYVWVSMEGIKIAGWMIVGVIGLAFAVALAAMFGFDKLKELVSQWTGIQAIKAKEADKNV